ncbi:MAG: hypothetical protein HWN67_19165 [Candidatus Helarchaeota archaeon]|nr:hypothetical protein [Candidatus Helarchaeota archaeon]
MGDKEIFDYYIEDEILDSLRNEFSVDILVENLIEESESNYAVNWGKNLIKKTIKLNKDIKDRTGKILAEVSKKTSHNFPHIPQRYLEIAYLAIRPKDKWGITSSTLHNFNHTIVNCNIFNKLRKVNENIANKLVCKDLCLNLIETLYKELGLNIELNMTNNIPENKKCIFEVSYKG